MFIVLVLVFFVASCSNFPNGNEGSAQVASTSKVYRDGNGVWFVTGTFGDQPMRTIAVRVSWKRPNTKCELKKDISFYQNDNIPVNLGHYWISEFTDSTFYFEPGHSIEGYKYIVQLTEMCNIQSGKDSVIASLE